MTTWTPITRPWASSWSTTRMWGAYLMTKAWDYILTKAGQRIIVKVPWWTLNTQIWSWRPVIT